MQGATIRVVVKTMDDSRYEVIVSPDSTVAMLKAAIVEKTGLPVPQQRLIFRGRTLLDDDLLNACSITDGSTVHLVARCVHEMLQLYAVCMRAFCVRCDAAPRAHGAFPFCCSHRMCLVGPQAAATSGPDDSPQQTFIHVCARAREFVRSVAGELVQGRECAAAKPYPAADSADVACEA
jgi:hypothetical protein